MTSKVDGVPLLVKYRGEHQEAFEFLEGFKARLIANDFHGHAEVFYHEVILFEGLRTLKDNNLAFGRISASEKCTQLLIAVKFLRQHLDAAEKQISQNDRPRFELNENYFQILNQSELFIFKLASLLDVVAVIASHLFALRGAKNVPQKYGQQKARKNNQFNIPFNEQYQNRLLDNKTINQVLAYRHLSSHACSLKLLPFQQNGSWVLVLSDGTANGHILRNLLSEALEELVKYLSWFEQFFEIRKM